MIETHHIHHPALFTSLRAPSRHRLRRALVLLLLLLLLLKLLLLLLLNKLLLLLLLLLLAAQAAAAAAQAAAQAAAAAAEPLQLHMCVPVKTQRQCTTSHLRHDSLAVLGLLPHGIRSRRRSCLLLLQKPPAHRHLDRLVHSRMVAHRYHNVVALEAPA